MVQAGLVLEGGGMRGVYTSGVLDFFLEKGMIFESCYGVSAGACNACSYLSGQSGRAYHVIVDYLDDKNYCGMYSFLKTGDIFGVDMAYDKIPNELNPYDYEAFSKYEGKFYAVATDITTGKPEYFRIQDMKEDLIKVRASASLPWVSNNVMIDGKPYLDGGVSDSIPIRRSIKDGNRKNVVILTRDADYQKEPDGMAKFSAIRYHDYPALIHNMRIRHLRYNKTLAYLDKAVAAGAAFVIQPEEPVQIKRIEKDTEVLAQYYELGYADAKAAYPKLQEYLGI